MTHGTDSASPMWSIPGYGNSIPVMDPTGSGITWADQTGGLTKREAFAMAAITATAPHLVGANDRQIQEFADAAAKIADAMVVALNREVPA